MKAKTKIGYNNPIYALMCGIFIGILSCLMFLTLGVWFIGYSIYKIIQLVTVQSEYQNQIRKEHNNKINKTLQWSVQKEKKKHTT